MKRLTLAMALACVLSSAALAGEVPSGGYAPPDPDETTQTTPFAAPGDVPSGGYTEQTSTDPTLTVVMTILGFLSI